MSAAASCSAKLILTAANAARFLRTAAAAVAASSAFAIDAGVVTRAAASLAARSTATLSSFSSGAPASLSFAALFISMRDFRVALGYFVRP